jgi:hypothetical protein
VARNQHNYTQLAIGDCGHVVVAWPLVAELGGRNPEVVCEECTKAKYGLVDELLVWVRIKEPTVKPVAPSKPRAKKEKALSPWQSLLRQEGLF